MVGGVKRLVAENELKNSYTEGINWRPSSTSFGIPSIILFGRLSSAYSWYPPLIETQRALHTLF